MGPGSGSGRPGGNTLSQGEQQYYQALAKQKLGNKEGAEALFNELITTSATALNQPENSGADPSRSGRRQAGATNTAVAHYNAGLGYLGQGNKTKAREEFNASLTSSPEYLAAKIALDQL
jgi:tetratricopeptide (TPR) repeat protein